MIPRIRDLIDTIKDAVYGLVWALGQSFLEGLGEFGDDDD